VLVPLGILPLFAKVGSTAVESEVASVLLVTIGVIAFWGKTAARKGRLPIRPG
jgi:hypothetical protein